MKEHALFLEAVFTCKDNKWRLHYVTECPVKTSVTQCRLFTLNYPLLIQHILREARLYHATIDNLMHNRHMSYKGIWGQKNFGIKL